MCRNGQGDTCRMVPRLLCNVVSQYFQREDQPPDKRFTFSQQYVPDADAVARIGQLPGARTIKPQVYQAPTL